MLSDDAYEAQDESSIHQASRMIASRNLHASSSIQCRSHLLNCVTIFANSAIENVIIAGASQLLKAMFRTNRLNWAPIEVAQDASFSRWLSSAMPSKAIGATLGSLCQRRQSSAHSINCFRILLELWSCSRLKACRRNYFWTSQC